MVQLFRLQPCILCYTRTRYMCQRSEPWCVQLLLNRSKSGSHGTEPCHFSPCLLLIFILYFPISFSPSGVKKKAFLRQRCKRA